MTSPRPTREPLDVVSMVFGLLMVGMATAALWLAFTGSLDWNLLKTAAPFALVGVGALGLVLTRR
jgi:hypothetical protein